MLSKCMTLVTVGTRDHYYHQYSVRLDICSSHNYTGNVLVFTGYCTDEAWSDRNSEKDNGPY